MNVCVQCTSFKLIQNLSARKKKIGLSKKSGFVTQIKCACNKVSASHIIKPNLFIQKHYRFGYAAAKTKSKIEVNNFYPSRASIFYIFLCLGHLLFLVSLKVRQEW